MVNRYVHLTLANPDSRAEKLDLSFLVHNTDIARRWFELLTRACGTQEIYDRQYFSCFPFGVSKEEFLRRLNQRIDTINAYQPGTITLRPGELIDQELNNDLHVFYEKMIGSVQNLTPFYREAPDHVKQAILKFNTEIHGLESVIEADQKCADIKVAFLDTEKIPFEKNDYSLFSLERGFGDLAINYCEAGKQLYEVFKSNDHVVGDENIRPARLYSANFKALFPIGQNPDREPFFKWLHENGYEADSPLLSLGEIKVGRMMREPCFTGLSDREILHKIAAYQYIWSVKTSEEELAVEQSTGSVLAGVYGDAR